MPRNQHQQYPADSLNALAVRNNQLDIHDLPFFAPSGLGLPAGRAVRPALAASQARPGRKGER